VQLGAHVTHTIVLTIDQQMTSGQEVFWLKIVVCAAGAVVHGSIATFGLHGQCGEHEGRITISMQLFIDNITT
jgi:hypothetical protein